MDSTRTLAHPARKRLEPALVILFFFFLIVFVANGFLVYFASSSWTGLVSHNHYREGLAYNATLAQQQAQEALGWTMVVDASALHPGQSGALRLTFRDREQRPLSGAVIQGVLYRPVQESQDITFALDETAPGVYTATLSPASMGHWGVKINAKVRGETFRHDVRIFLAEAASEK